jgi:hypothetical protein
LLDDPGARAVLERVVRVASPEERVRAALERAHQRLRRFELAAVKQSLEDARAASLELPPSPEGRALAAEVAVREAEAALVDNDAERARAALSFAFAIEPALIIDPVRESPPLVEQAGRARAEREAAPRVRIRFESTPPGARVLAGAAWRGETPLELELGAGPQLVWLAREGHQTRAQLVDAQAGGRVSFTLAPLDEAARLQPLVDAVRRSEGEPRRQAALALAAALRVDVIAVLGGADAPILYERATPAPLAGELATPRRAPSSRRWYQKGWVWGVVAGSALVLGAVAGVAGYYGQPERVVGTCCR